VKARRGAERMPMPRPASLPASHTNPMKRGSRPSSTPAMQDPHARAEADWVVIIIAGIIHHWPADRISIAVDELVVDHHLCTDLAAIARHQRITRL
jgi:hypothetical protein